MKNLTRILAVVNHADDGEVVLLKALTLAESCGASVHLVKVCYEGFVDLSVHDINDSQALKSFVLQSEKTFLDELVGLFPNSSVVVDGSVIWNKSQCEGILDAAGEAKADFIIKATSYPVTEVIRTPQDWHLLRRATIPVMLVKPIKWQDQPVVVAAIDVEDEQHGELNNRILSFANGVTGMLTGKLKLINAFPSVEHWVGPITVAIDFEKVRQRVKAELEHKLKRSADQLGITPDGLSAVEGEVHTAIEAQVRDTDAEILVMGTSQRSGARGAFIGNTSESIIHHVNCDVIVLR